MRQFNEEFFFSILIPVYNVEKYLFCCIESIINQTFNDYECILVNDGSTDRSGSICDECANKFDKLKVFHKNNEGLMVTRRFAVDRAKGKYLLFLDSDDYLNERALSVIYERICKYQYQCDCLIFGLKRVYNGKGIKSGFDNRFNKDIVIDNKKDLYKLVLENDIYNPLCRKAIKSDLIKGKDYSQYYYISFAEDLLQSLDIYQSSQTTVIISDVLYYYRINPNSITEGLEYENFNVDFTVREKVLELLKKENIFDDIEMMAYKSYCVHLVIDQIRKIARFEVDEQLKSALYGSIKEKNYYIDYIGVNSPLNLNKYDRTVFSLFKKRKYKKIYLLERFVKILGNIKFKIRRR